MAAEARIRRSFRPGFVLDDNVVGEAVERPGGKRLIFIHQDGFAQVVKAHRQHPSRSPPSPTASPCMS